MSERLYVHFGDQTIGELCINDSAMMQFCYFEDWVQSQGAFPISLSLPLDGSFAIHASHYFFANLLPEGNVRQQICKSLGISQSNDFLLLGAIGGDCAGALAITRSEVPERTGTPPQYEAITEEQLALWSIGTPDAFSAMTGRNQVRLSLAGAQDKLPVCMRGDEIVVPIGDTPSTHILKFASPFYSHLPENETFVTLLAKAVQLAVVDVGLRQTNKARVAVITRYDRVLIEGRYKRLHQEDFCQAMGISSSNKYEKEGGPSLEQCAELLRRYTAFPLLELHKLLRWSIFNLIVGNADAHGKNLSLLYDANGTPGLAPFYDLVCTRNYKKISRDLAMTLGGVSDPDQVGTKQLQALASNLHINANAVVRETNLMIDQISEALPHSIENFATQFGDSPAIQRIPIIVRKQLRRLKNLLKN